MTRNPLGNPSLDSSLIRDPHPLAVSGPHPTYVPATGLSEAPVSSSGARRAGIWSLIVALRFGATAAHQ